jgi:hypothetical protein
MAMHGRSALAHPSGSRRAASLALAALTVVLPACPGSKMRGPDSSPPSSASEGWEVAITAYDGGLKEGWEESGTAIRDRPQADAGGGPAKLRFGDSGEWILSRAGLADPYGGVLFHVKEPEGDGEFLEVRLGLADKRPFPGVKLRPAHKAELPGGWTQVLVPMNELAPNGAAFDRIVFRPFRPFNEWVYIDQIGLTKGLAGVPAAAPPAPGPGPAPAPAPGDSGAKGARPQPGRVRIACDAKPTKISPFIYGIATGDKDWSGLGVAARRWGGNPTTRYNWESHCSNHGNDWFFENQCGGTYTDFLADNAAHKVASAVTVPMIGWVSKDATSFSFPVSVFGPQQKTDPWHSDAGNGLSPSGAKLPPGPPSRTSVPAPPDWAKRWVAAIRASDAKTGKRSVYEYILDNEPMLWNSTHRDVHPDPVGYDELLERTTQYAAAIREADPDAVIAGPAEWGWSNYVYSARDLAEGFGAHLDRRAHGDVPLVEWYLRKLRDYEQKTHVRLLDVFDLHYYPQENNVYGGGAGGTDRPTQLLRLRSTRSLWDPSYVDESWIKDTVRLLPRMKEWVDANYPGRGISIGEWNFGGEKDITGALATAEVLGRFAQFGVTSAFYWLAPPTGSASSFGFLAYRNFNGRGGRFLDWFVPATAGGNVSVFASRDSESKHFVVVAINLSPDAAQTAGIDFKSCGVVSSEEAFLYGQGGSAFAPASAAGAPQADGGASDWDLPPWSILVVDAHLR